MGMTQVVKVTDGKFVKFHIQDLLNCRKCSSLSYIAWRYEFTKVFISGVVIGIEEITTTGNVIFTVDDGTGTIGCTLLLSDEKSQDESEEPQSSSQGSQVSLQLQPLQPSTNQPTKPVIPSLGNYVRVVGRLNEYNDERNIIVTRHKILESYKDHLADMQRLMEVYETAVKHSSSECNITPPSEEN